TLEAANKHPGSTGGNRPCANPEPGFAKVAEARRMISIVQLIAQRLCQGKYVEASKGLSPQLLNKETVRAFKILHSSHLPCLFGEPPGMQPRRYLAIVRIWPRISPPGETCVCTFAYA